MCRTHRFRVEQRLAAESHNRGDRISARNVTYGSVRRFRRDISARSTVPALCAMPAAARAGIGDDKFYAVEIFDISVHKNTSLLRNIPRVCFFNLITGRPSTQETLFRRAPRERIFIREKSHQINPLQSTGAWKPAAGRIVLRTSPTSQSSVRLWKTVLPQLPDVLINFLQAELIQAVVRPECSKDIFKPAVLL